MATAGEIQRCLRCEAVMHEHGQHEIGWIKGYAAALDTAREAVAVIRGKWVFGPASTSTRR